MSEAKQKAREAFAQLSSEERASFAAEGWVVPVVDPKGGDQRVYGYRCKHCGKIALEFVGTSFDVGNGQMIDHPPSGLAISRLPWVQPLLPPNMVKREQPICQQPQCFQPVALHNSSLIPKLVVNMQDFEKSFCHNPRARVNEILKGEPKTEASHNPDGTPITLSRQYDEKERSLNLGEKRRQNWDGSDAPTNKPEAREYSDADRALLDAVVAQNQETIAQVFAPRPKAGRKP